MKERNLSAESTIYNYKLLKKMPYPLPYRLAFILLLGIAALSLFTVYGLLSLAALACSYILVQALHLALIRLLLKTSGYTAMRGKWSLHKHFPVNGFLPDGFAAAAPFRRLHNHLLIVGTAVIGLLYMWVPSLYFYALLLIHAWVLLPRFIPLLLFRKLKKPGLIKCNAQDMSYYIP